MEGSQEDAQGSSVLASGELFGKSKARSVAKYGLGLGDEIPSRWLRQNLLVKGYDNELGRELPLGNATRFVRSTC